jgi:mannosyl-3-phosphoglycerate phosphatase
MRLVFTDLDGSLLDAETYSFDAARPALQRLQRAGTPLVPVTSKTRAEVEWWRRLLSNRDPFIVENGGALFLPEFCLPFAIDGAICRDGYGVVEFGQPYERLVTALLDASRETGCAVSAFHAMEAEQVARRCGLTIEQAQMAKAREYDEAFEIQCGAERVRLLEALERRGLRWTRGGRFYHVMGGSDKARAVKAARDLYVRAYGEVTTIGIGDAPNDAGFLGVVDYAVIIRSPMWERMTKLVPRGHVTQQPGPAGWNEAILTIFDSPCER